MAQWEVLGLGMGSRAGAIPPACEDRTWVDSRVQNASGQPWAQGGDMEAEAWGQQLARQRGKVTDPETSRPLGL